ncbi:ABC transporter ATP-binding protein [Clostridium sediminicola]|uniref:ABC transporter ATP-binding protein n=1 Tax=Clostridium sediminicola TaxID=3114879 RepID=UPI0031F20DEF
MIKIENLIKRYGSDIAVDNVSLSINKGEVFGLLGPNGAGKSTTIRIMMGLLKANSGIVKINDKAISKNSLDIKRILGYVPQELAIYENMSAKENVEFFGRLYGLRGKELKNRVNETLHFTGLSEKEKVKVKKFSGGMKRRLNIACAIVHNPSIVIMDEPTVGIDPQSRNHILESVKELNKRGATIIYTSHYMEEVESICTRVGIMDFGKLIALGTKQELKLLLNDKEKINIDTDGINSEVIDEIKNLRGVSSLDVKSNSLEIISKNAQQILQDVLFILSTEDIKVKNILIKEPDLESLFLQLTGKNLRE